MRATLVCECSLKVCFLAGRKSQCSSWTYHSNMPVTPAQSHACHSCSSTGVLDKACAVMCCRVCASCRHTHVRQQGGPASRGKRQTNGSRLGSLRRDGDDGVDAPHPQPLIGRVAVRGGFRHKFPWSRSGNAQQAAAGMELSSLSIDMRWINAHAVTWMAFIVKMTGPCFLPPESVNRTLHDSPLRMTKVSKWQVGMLHLEG